MLKNESIIFCLVFSLVAGTVCYFLVDRKEWKLDKLALLATVSQKENDLMSAQLEDYKQHVFQFRDNEYRKGFEAGKTQAIVTFMNGDTILGYSDGYHAALSQFGPADSNTTLTPYNSGFLIMYQDALEDENEADAEFYRDMLIAQLDEDFGKVFQASKVIRTVSDDYVPVGDLSEEENILLHLLQQDLEKIPVPNEQPFEKLDKRQ